MKMEGKTGNLSSEPSSELSIGGLQRSATVNLMRIEPGVI